MLSVLYSDITPGLSGTYNGTPKRPVFYLCTLQAVLTTLRKAYPFLSQHSLPYTFRLAIYQRKKFFIYFI